MALVFFIRPLVKIIMLIYCLTLKSADLDCFAKIKSSACLDL